MLWVDRQPMKEDGPKHWSRIARILWLAGVHDFKGSWSLVELAQAKPPLVPSSVTSLLQVFGTPLSKGAKDHH